MAFKDLKYTTVPGEEASVESQDENEPSAISRTNTKTKVGILTLVIVASIGVGMLLGSIRPLSLSRGSLSKSKPRVTDCGRTSADAISRGCVMEPMIYGWMPPHCQYSEVTDNYFINKWSWYADENLTIPLTEQDLWQGKSLKIWNGQAGYHTEHCLFLWEKASYAQKRRLPWLDRKSLSYDHGIHCIEQLKALGEGEDPITRATLGIYECDSTPWTK